MQTMTRILFIRIVCATMSSMLHVSALLPCLEIATLPVAALDPERTLLARRPLLDAAVSWPEKIKQTNTRWGPWGSETDPHATQYRKPLVEAPPPHHRSTPPPYPTPTATTPSYNACCVAATRTTMWCTGQITSLNKSKCERDWLAVLPKECTRQTCHPNHFLHAKS